MQKNHRTYSNDLLVNSIEPEDADVKRTLLVNLRQARIYKMSVDVKDGAVLRFRGPLDMVDWKDLHRIYDAIKAAIVRVGLVDEELLQSDPFLQRVDSGWVPVFQIWTVDSGERDLNLKKICAVAQATLAGLKRDSADTSIDLMETDLEEFESAAVRGVVLEVLSADGGRRITEPVYVAVNDQEYRLEGKLGAKPNRSNFHPQEESLNGKFFGFDGHKSELLFVGAGGQMHINFDVKLVNLHTLVNVYLEDEECTVRVHKTISKQGAKVYSLLPGGPLGHQL